jgi:hypothetical protein
VGGLHHRYAGGKQRRPPRPAPSPQAKGDRPPTGRGPLLSRPRRRERAAHSGCSSPGRLLTPFIRPRTVNWRATREVAFDRRTPAAPTRSWRLFGSRRDRSGNFSLRDSRKRSK